MRAAATAITYILMILVPAGSAAGVLLSGRRKGGFVFGHALLFCYGAGLVTGILLPGGGGLDDGRATAASLAVILAVPLFILPNRPTRTLRAAVEIAVPYLLLLVSIPIGAVGAFIALAPSSPDAPRLATAISAAFIGGEPTLDRVHQAMRLGEHAYIAVRSAVRLLMPIFVLLMVGVGKPVLSRTLRSTQQGEERHPAVGPFERIVSTDALLSLAVSTLIGGGALATSLLVPRSLAPAPVLVIVTFLSWVLSFIPKLRALQGGTAAGRFAVLFFAFASGSMAGRVGQTPLPVLGAAALVLVVSISVYVLLSRMSRSRADAVMMTSLTTVASPPFALLAVRASGPDERIAAAVLVGTLSYLLGPPISRVILLLLSNI